MVDATTQPKKSRPARGKLNKPVLIVTEEATIVVTVIGIRGDEVDFDISALTAPLSIRTIDKVSTNR